LSLEVDQIASKKYFQIMSSAILAAKPIKSWYEVVIEEEETTKPPQVQTGAVQHWVDTISKSP